MFYRYKISSIDNIKYDFLRCSEGHEHELTLIRLFYCLSLPSYHHDMTPETRFWQA